MKTIQIGGIQIAYNFKGKGPPLVLLHGALSDHRMWYPQLEVLSDEFTVIAWDAPGCGESTDPPEDFNLADFADVLALMLKRVNVNHAHVLGLSFGGGLAFEFYRRHPRIPSSLILASAYAGWAGSLPSEAVTLRLNNGLQQSHMPPQKVVEKWLPTLFNEDSNPEIIEKTAEIMADFHPIGMRAMLRAFANADLRDALSEIKVPTLLLYGEDDQRSPMNVAKDIHARIPESRLITIQDVGHLCNLEAPAKFNREVRRFLHSAGI
jgi:pimeloyl-ACP methyl ester carboxylesterase